MEAIVEFLVAQYLFDMWVLQQWWLWAPLGIPGVCYVAFMWLKWVTFAMPITAALNGFRNAVVQPLIDGHKKARKDA